jgi:hypothetical protein
MANSDALIVLVVASSAIAVVVYRNLWTSNANKYIQMLSINCLQDAVLAIDR